MFGIGGGVVLTPALCLLTNMPHACVLGTTLASMVPPSLVSAATHSQVGNVVSAAVVPLVAGSALGAFASAQLALQLPEEPLGLGFLGGRVGYQCRSGDLPLPTYRHAKQQQDHLPLPTYLSPTVTCNRHVHM